MQTPEFKLGVYQHYKGKMYLLLGVGAHEETHERFVIYVPLYEAPGPRMWVRPIKTFDEVVAWPNGEQAPRFKYMGAEFPGELGKN